MPKSSPLLTEPTATALVVLGEQLAARRKTLRVSATALAEAAGVSRVTVHRIEKGEPSVTMGAWCSVISAVGLHLQLAQPQAEQNSEPADRSACLPVRIALADYPQLKALAWQVHGVDTISPVEAFGIYERNARHLDMQAMTPEEQQLWKLLEQVFAQGAPDV